MKLRSLLAAVVVLLILGGVLYWSQHRKTPDAASTASPTTPTIVNLEPAAVASFTLKQHGTEPVTLVSSGPTAWQITAPGAFPADAATVSALFSGLHPLNAERVVEDHATNLAQFGLSDPATELDVTGKDKKTTRLLIGDDTPTGDAAYAALGGDPRLFTVPSWIKTGLNKNLGDLRDKRLLPVDASSISSFDLIRKAQTIDFARVQNGWQIEKPQPYRTDNFQVDDLLQQLTSAKWDPTTPADNAAKAFAKATPLATAKLTGSAGTETLDIRKDKDEYFAKSTAVPGAWKVDPSAATALGQALGHNLDDFRNKQLFDFGYADPEKIEYHSPPTSLVLTRTGNDWSSNGKKMTTDSVENLVTALRDLAATKFVDAGFTAPEIEITVTSNGGKKIEKVQLQKTTDGAIAKREDDPSLYSLDSTTIGSLTNAIAGITPAGTPKK
ncbi:MAG: DUF4340 domain-containing protein [Acidobacteriaceae bacterium]